jgi:hypothetical protein
MMARHSLNYRVIIVDEQLAQAKKPNFVLAGK